MNLRELTYRIYGDDRLSGKLNRINAAGLKTDRVLGGVSKKTGLLKTNLRGAAAEIPGLSSGLRFLSNPLTIAVGGFTLLASGLNKAKNEAVAFNSEFRELINLNLDKNPFNRALMKANVLKLAQEKGFDPLQTSKGFYDIQSVTGKHGYEVKQIVSKQGEFAQVFQADFNKWIEGTGKAMANYGFAADKLDEFNRSAYATVNVGSITFDELGQLQAIYAGAAASAKQSFNSANQLMTMFTVKTEKANEAATMTKSAFIDLFKESTVKAFHNAGVDMYDEITGKARQVKDIMMDLNKEFMKGGSDKALDNLRNQFTGSLGLNMLIQTATDTSGNFLRTLELFDNVDFNYGNALKEAIADVNYLNNQINNKLRVSWINMGQAVLPAWISIKQEILSTIDSINDSMYDKMRMYYRVFDNDKYKEMGMIRSRQHRDAGFGQAKDKYASLFEGNMSKLSEGDLKKKIEELQGLKAKELTKPKLIALGTTDDELNDAQNNRTGYRKFFNQTIQALENKNFTALSELYGGFNGGGGGGNGGSGTDGNISKGLTDISGGGSQMKYVTVNIEKLNENINITTTTLTESAIDAEQQLTEMLMRAVGGAEQMI